MNFGYDFAQKSSMFCTTVWSSTPGTLSKSFRFSSWVSSFVRLKELLNKVVVGFVQINDTKAIYLRIIVFFLDHYGDRY